MYIPLREWFKENVPTESLLYAKSMAAQVKWVIGKLQPLFAEPEWCYDEYIDRSPARVIGTHRSKSVTLPVYHLSGRDVQMVLRDNFYNWKLSVISPIAIDASMIGSLFITEPPKEPEYTGDRLSSVYFEGFPSEWIFGYHANDPRRFSAELHSDDKLYVVIYSILHQNGFFSKAEYRTRESHERQLELDNERAEAYRKLKDNREQK